MNGYFSISRDIDDTLKLLPGNAVKLYVYLTARAAFRDSVLCPRGCLFDTLEGLAKGTDLSVQNIRTSLKKLEISGLLGENQQLNKQLSQQVKRGHFIEIKHYVDPHQANSTFNSTANSSLTTHQQITNSSLTALEDVRSTPRVLLTSSLDVNDVYARKRARTETARKNPENGKTAERPPTPVPPTPPGGVPGLAQGQDLHPHPEEHPNVKRVQRLFAHPQHPEHMLVGGQIPTDGTKGPEHQDRQEATPNGSTATPPAPKSPPPIPRIPSQALQAELPIAPPLPYHHPDPVTLAKVVAAAVDPGEEPIDHEAAMEGEKIFSDFVKNFKPTPFGVRALKEKPVHPGPTCTCDDCFPQIINVQAQYGI